MADDVAKFQFPDHKFQRMLSSAVLFQQDWRQRNTANYRYYDGDQWSAADIEQLMIRGQQASVLNIIRPTVDQILALEQQRRADIQVVGREPDDGPMSDILTKLLKQVFDDNSFDYYLGKTFREGVIGGAGWIEVSVNDESGRNEVEVNHIPWDEVYADPYSKKPDSTDARFIIRQVWMDRDQLIDEFPEKKDMILQEMSLLTSAVTADFKGHEHTAQSRGVDIDTIFDDRRRRVAVNDTWYKDETGEIRHTIWMSNVFLEGVDPDEDGNNDAMNPSPYKANIFPLISFYAFRNRKGEPQGIVEFLLSIQDALNKSQSKYIWAQSARQVMAEEGAIDNPEEMREEIAKPDGVIMVQPGRLGAVQLLDHVNESQLLMQNMNFLLAMSQRVSGVNDATLGIGGTNARSALQESSRLLQGSSMQTSIIENLFFTRRQVANITLRLIGQFYNESRVVRITQINGFNNFIELNGERQDEETGKMVKINQIDDLLHFDVVLKEVEQFNTVKQLQLSQVVEAAKGGIIPPEIASQLIITLSDMPGKQELLQQTAIFFERQRQEQALAAQQEQELAVQQQLQVV